MNNYLLITRLIVLHVLALCVVPACAQSLLGEEPALGPMESRITQEEITNNGLLLSDIRSLGLRMFATQFRRSDGYGDGPMNPADTLTPGGRPMLQDNGTFLRVNGLDGQACLDCHAITSADTMPVTFGIGGAGGLNNSPMFMTKAIDAEDIQQNGFADFNGRLINPPALFGTGAVQLLGKEMTLVLHSKKAKAIASPGKVVTLRAKGVDFGTIVANDLGEIDSSNVSGIDSDLIVRPFGRKGEFSSVRGFDLGALMFHFGMQPIEVVGENVDDDEDGVANEVLAGEVSALEIFVTTQETPVQLPQDNAAQNGFRIFQRIGCANCHKPEMAAHGKDLKYAFPEIEDDPSANIFYTVDLTKTPPAFDSIGKGIRVKLFSDLKRHDMGERLAENFHAATEQQNREFITAKLWGVADTAPYLHDGRALTLNEAIMLHGGEAASTQAEYAALDFKLKNYLLSFLKTLRNPANPNSDVVDL